MALLRNILFECCWALWTLLFGVLSPFILPSRRACIAVAAIWARGSLWLLSRICRIDVQMVGVPDLSVTSIIASKHQSTLDTLTLWLALDNPAFILKKELLYIPVFGWFLARTNPIAIDRRAGHKAAQHIGDLAAIQLRAGRHVVIFPEGTRRPIGAPPAYRSGGLKALYASGFPVIPVALNTGYFWPKGAWRKQPGCAQIEWLRPVSAGLDPQQMYQQVTDKIERASSALVPNATLRGDAGE